MSKPTRKQNESSGLPYGSGNIRLHGRQYWLTFKDVNGAMIQEPSGTDDYEQARRLLAQASINVLQARIARLQAVIDGTDHGNVQRSASKARGRGANNRRAAATAGNRRKGSSPRAEGK